MKKISFVGGVTLAFLSGLLLTGCAENDYHHDNLSNHHITFTPSVVEESDWNATRGTLFTGTSFGSGDVFGVSGYRYDGTTATPATATANFLYKAEVRRILEHWRTTDNYVWPASGDKLDFYAYYPYNHANVEVKAQQTAGPMQIDYTVNASPKQQVDLMTAAAKNLDFSQELEVDLGFRHQLTAVRLVLADNVAPGYVKSVSFNHIATQGTLTVGEGWGSLNDGSFTLDLTADYDATNGFSTTNSDHFIAAGSELTAATTTLLMIPQTFTAENQKISVVFVNDDHPEGVELSTRLTGEWQAGQQVTYQLSTTDINVVLIDGITYPATSTWGNAWLKSAYANGDAVGIYAIDAEGTVKVDNTRLTLNGSGQWKTDEGTTLLFTPGLQWFMYSPYKAAGLAHNGKKDGEVVSTADDFFHDGIAAWNPNDNQSSEADLLAQDLQIAKGTLTQASMLHFDMAHTMGLVHLSIPEAKTIKELKYYNTSGNVDSSDGEEKVVGPSSSFTTATRKPHYDSTSKLHFFVVRPGTNTVIAPTSTTIYDAWDANVTANVAANSYSTYTAANKMHTRNYIKRGWVYSYTANNNYSLTAPATGTYTLEVWGAQGGAPYSITTAYSNYVKGGYSIGTKDLAKGNVLRICVGSAGGMGTSQSASVGTGGAGGYNGGGKGGDSSTATSACGGGGGGGATHIAMTNAGTLYTLLNNASTKSSVLIVGGGGGGGTYHQVGGYGGGTSGGPSQDAYPIGIGGNAGSSNIPIQEGGSASNYYQLGQGQAGYKKTIYNGHGTCGTGGGGGGYYGGKAYQGQGQYTDVGGSGGSGYIGGVSGGTTTAGQRAGNGYARITENFIE